MMSSYMKTLSSRLAPLAHWFQPDDRWDDAEVRAYLERPAPTPELNIVRVILALGICIAAANIAWLLLSYIKG